MCALSASFFGTPIHVYFEWNMIKSSSFVNEVLSFYLIKQLSKRLLDALTAVHYNRRRRKELVTVFKRAWNI